MKGGTTSQLTAELIYGFSGSLLSRRYDQPKPTPPCHMEWWELCCSNHPFVAIAAPRGHAKSTAITHAYTLACVLFKERKFILLISDTYEQAVLFLQDIATELRENDELIDTFDIDSFEKDAENDIIVRFKTGEKFRIVAKGSEQKVRGLKWDGARPDLIVCDDLENDEIVLNKERREKFRNWFTGALLPCRSEHGIVRIVGTILHLDSLLERLLPKEWSKHTVVEPLKSYSKTIGDGSWCSVRYRAHSPDFKHILWPGRWSKEELLKEKNRYVEQGQAEVYAREYLNYPIDESTAYFRKDDFLPITNDDKKKARKYYAAIDFAITKDDKADWTVVVVGGVDPEGYLYIEDIFRMRLDAMEIVDLMISVHNRYSPDMFTVERGLIEKSIGPFLNRRMVETGQYLNLNPMLPTKDKESRARSLQARMRAGRVKFDKDADWYPQLEMEMLQFPKSRHDDQVDAMAWLGLTLDKMIEALTPEEQDREAWEEEVRNELGSFNLGISVITGY